MTCHTFHVILSLQTKKFTQDLPLIEEMRFVQAFPLLGRNRCFFKQDWKT